MPFYTQRFRLPVQRGHVFLNEIVERDKGNGEKELAIESVDQSKDLPDFDKFDLKNQLEGGVKLENVNYKMFPASSIPVDYLLNSKKGEQINKQEQTNKQEQINNSQQTNTNKGE